MRAAVVEPVGLNANWSWNRCETPGLTRTWYRPRSRLTMSRSKTLDRTGVTKIDLKSTQSTAGWLVLGTGVIQLSFHCSGTTEELYDILKIWLIGLAIQGADKRKNQTGRPSNPVAVLAVALNKGVSYAGSLDIAAKCWLSFSAVGPLYSLGYLYLLPCELCPTFCLLPRRCCANTILFWYRFSTSGLSASCLSASWRVIELVCQPFITSMLSTHWSAYYTQATLIARILYAAPAWWGFLNSAEKDRIKSVINKAQCYGYLPSSFENVHSLVDNMESKLFNNSV